jgi:hypothetical protein
MNDMFYILYLDLWNLNEWKNESSQLHHIFFNTNTSILTFSMNHSFISLFTLTAILIYDTF